MNVNWVKKKGSLNNIKQNLPVDEKSTLHPGMATVYAYRPIVIIYCTSPTLFFIVPREYFPGDGKNIEDIRFIILRFLKV